MTEHILITHQGKAAMTNKNPSKKLPRAKPETHRFLIHFPKALWERIIGHGLAWGDVTKFVIDAVTEKLDREEAKKK